MTHPCNYEMSHDDFEKQIKSGELFWNKYVYAYNEEPPYYILMRKTDKGKKPVCKFKQKGFE